MRNLNRPFEQINEEQLIRRIYNWVSPLDNSSPDETALTLPFGRTQDFAVEVPNTSTHELEVSWYLDGQFQGTSLQFKLDTKNLSLSSHVVDVEVWDLTEKVRFDPASVLSDQRSWSVQIYLSGDFGEDGDVDGSDLSDLANEYLKKKSSLDLNGDGFLDELDVGEFALDFGMREH